MNAPDALPGSEALLPPDTTFRNEVAVRFTNHRYLPARHAATKSSSRSCSVSATPTVSRRRLKPCDTRAPHREGNGSGPDAGHFNYYLGEPFEALVGPGQSFSPANCNRRKPLPDARSIRLEQTLPLRGSRGSEPRAAGGDLRPHGHQDRPISQFQSVAKEQDVGFPPFDPARPAITAPFLDFRLGERGVHTSLSARVREVVILAGGTIWQTDYELYAYLAVRANFGLCRRRRPGGGLRWTPRRSQRRREDRPDTPAAQPATASEESPYRKPPSEQWD